MVGHNLIVVIARGLRADVAGLGGSWPQLTPKMHSLARRGVQLLAHSACPADDGGLVSLLTGLHARQHGCLDPTNGDQRCAGWPQWLRASGYYVAGVGCVGAVAEHLNRTLLVQPVNCLDPAACAYAQAMASRGLWTVIAQQRRVRLRQGPLDVPRVEIDAKDDVDAFIATQAADALNHLPKTHPWALLTIFTGPGNDLPAPRPYNQLLAPQELDCQFIPADLRTLDAVADLDCPRAVLQRLDPRSLALLLSDYLGRVALVDLGVGLLARAARQRPDADRTWIVVLSDHGKLLGEAGLIGHRSFLAPALEVPILLAPLKAPDDAREERPQRIDGLISTVDAAATIAELAACDLPAACVGRSLLPAVHGHKLETLAAETGCLSEFGRRLMLQTDRHKIILNVDTRQVLGIYDLLNDPLETKNLSATVLGKNLVDALRCRVSDALLGLRLPPSAQ